MIVMLNHGASINSKRQDREREREQNKKEKPRNNGKKPEEMTTDEIYGGLMALCRG